MVTETRRAADHHIVMEFIHGFRRSDTDTEDAGKVRTYGIGFSANAESARLQMSDMQKDTESIKERRED